MKTHFNPKLLAIPALLLLGAAPVFAANPPGYIQGTTYYLNETPNPAPVGERQSGTISIKDAVAAILKAGNKAGSVMNEMIAKIDVRDASEVAAEIGAQFKNNPELAAQADALAVGYAKALLAKGLTGEIRYQIAVGVASLVSQLPGAISSNQERIASIAKSVASLSPSGDLAISIAGYTANALKAAAGEENIQPTLTYIADKLKSGLDSSTQQRLETVVNNVINGQTFNEIPSSPNAVTKDPAKTINNNISSGAPNPQETPKTSG